ncbi:uncharacterized protein PV07_04969 [Cladophialophora immunda]|uniref:KANL3/Tex30 alpha/beta hydrolase-like domain-containing protein n=1 Tax=Cladophialophora immunda TaxID=569365 RepID=A0A0D2AV40_9EURO|nr:uncharacterized protein PV07_04969 [Cladophialophora immunda]KIW29132.1 hypothetical protein PV07_04969 [Cladophialophora immunda]OQU96975.1 hypothetical protein CLAIMM_02980 [Cladophialophora immunda]
MAPRSTRRATASAANEGANLKSEVPEAKPQVEGGEDVDMSSKENASTTERPEKSTTTATLPPSLNLGSSTIKFAPFTISSAAPGKSGKSSKETSCLRSHRAPHSTSLIFTHGAGGDLSAAAMVNFSQGFASTGSAIVMFPGNMNVKARAGLFGVVRAYEVENGSLAGPGGGGDDPSSDGPKGKGSGGAMGQGDAAGKKRKIEAQNAPLAYGGRSMGARAAVIASHTDSEVRALVLASYPLVGPSGDIRDKILLDVQEDVDVLFISGDNDNMCPLERLQAVREKMKARTWRMVVKGADHGMNIRGGKKLKEGTERLGKECGRVAAEWLRERDPDCREMEVRWDGETGRVLGKTWADSETGTTQGARKTAKKEAAQGVEEEESDEAQRVGTKRKRTKK